MADRDYSFALARKGVLELTNESKEAQDGFFLANERLDSYRAKGALRRQPRKGAGDDASRFRRPHSDGFPFERPCSPFPILFPLQDGEEFQRVPAGSVDLHRL